MATQIKLRRDTAANWLLEDPVLGAGEPGFELVTGKLKIGDGTSLWSALDYIVAEPDGSIDLAAVDKNLLPATDNTYDLGSPAKRWRHLYAASGSVYVGDIKLSNSSGTLIVQQVTNAGLINEAPVASPGTVTTDRISNGIHSFSINASGVLQLDGSPYLGGDTALPTNTLGYLYNDGTGTLTWASGAGGGVGGSSDRLVNGVNEVVLEADGTIALPTLTTKDWNGNSSTGPTLALGERDSNVVITQQPYDSNTRGNKNIEIRGQRGFGTWSTTGNGGFGGNIEIQGGQGGETGDDLSTGAQGGEGGYVEIRGGKGQAGDGGGFIDLRAGDAGSSIGSPNDVYGGTVNIQAGSANDSIEVDKGFGGDVFIGAGVGNKIGQHGNVTINTYGAFWTFGQNGVLANDGSYTKITMNSLNGGVASQVVWTSTVLDISGAKLTIQVETDETGGVNTWETQMCEAVIAVRGHTTTSIPVISVYGVTHTSVAPLMTFTVDRNPTTSFIEITGTRTGTASPTGGASLRIHSVETGTMD